MPAGASLREQPGGGAPVQVGRELGDEADLGAAVVQLADQEADPLAGLGEIGRGLRPVDQRADRVGLVGQRGQHVGGVEHAHDLVLAPHDEVAHAPARHQQGRLEQEAVLVDPDHAVVDEVAHRRLQRLALAPRRCG